jgi:NTE family protein
MINPPDSTDVLPLRLPGRNGPRPRTVLVLGGGGMRGMAHIGVLKALQTLGIHYDAVVGTSIGAFVGAMVCGGKSIEDIENTLIEVQKQDYFRLNTVKLLLKGTRAPSMYQGKVFKESLKKMLPEVELTEMQIPFYCNAVRLESGGTVYWGTPGFTEISLVDAVYSSCSLPGIFEPLQWEGHNYVDGGIVDSVPLRFAKTLDGDLIIAVDLTVKSTFKTPNYQRRVLSTIFRMFEIVEEVLVEQSLHMHVDYRVALIQPKVGHLHRFDFGQVSEVIRAGEEEALRVLTAHTSTRDLVSDEIRDGLVCPVTPRDHVSLHLDPTLCVGCGMCQMVCETDGYWAEGGVATVRKSANYECTRDYACVRNCPTNAISLGNL